MRRELRVVGIVVAVGWWAACGSAAQAPAPSRRVVQLPLHPPPTENRIEEGEEEEHHEERREWLEQRHRAPPGVDWKRAEQGNARASLDRAREVWSGRARPPGTWV